MTDQPRDLAAEVERIRLNPPTRFNPVCEWSVRSAATPGVESADDGYLVFRSAYASHTSTLLEHIAALSRELEELRGENYAMSHDDGKLEREFERLRAENERLTKDLAHWKDCHGVTADSLAAAESELAALRRPVEQSREIEAIRKTYKLGPATHTEIERLLSALDQAQREIAGMARDNQSLTELIRQQRDEIARLSSPPQERAEIVERQRLGWPQPLPCHAQAAADISALLGDCAAWRNAHALVTAERDEARGKVERLDKDRTGWINANSPGGWIDDLRVRIERLEGALEWYADTSHWTALDDGSDQEQENLLTAGLDHGWLRAHNALAAADGQQEDLYYLQCTEGVVGNSALFWREGGCGYTCDLDQAGLFPRERAFSQNRCRSIDVPRLKSEMDAIAQRHVHVDQMPRASGTGDGVEGE